jgi:hypothetical protein
MESVRTFKIACGWPRDRREGGVCCVSSPVNPWVYKSREEKSMGIDMNLRVLERTNKARPELVEPNLPIGDQWGYLIWWEEKSAGASLGMANEMVGGSEPAKGVMA